MLEISDMTALRAELEVYLRHFDGCFKSTPTRGHLRTYVRGQVSNLDRKSVEPIALAAGVPPRTLQEFLSLHRWDHDLVMSRLRALVMRDHGDADAVAVIDETSFPKKGDDTVGVKRQYCGQTGKIDNCVVSVHLTYAAGDFRCLVDGDLFLPEDWAGDADRQAKAEIPHDSAYRPKWQIALDLLARSMADGMRFSSLTADEEYGRTGPFREGVEKLGLTYVVEVPCNTAVWTMNADDRRESATRADLLLKPSRRWQAHHIKDTEKGPCVWRARAVRVRVRGEKLKAGQECWLIVASNTVDEETKFFLSNAPTDADLASMLRVAFSRAHIERCFQDAKGEVGMGHFEARRYKPVMRHLILSMVSLYFLMDQSHRLRGKKPVLEPVPGKADRRSAA
jgi:SRSO17 transposase